MISSYGSIYALGHKAVATILDGEVEATEKIDGSQFSFGMVAGRLVCRSKGQVIDQNDPGMFRLAVQSAIGAMQRPPVSSRHFAGNARSPLRVPLLMSLPVLTAPIVRFISTQRCPHTGVAESFAKSSTNLNTDAKFICVIL